MKLRMIALPMIAAVAVTAALVVTGCGQSQPPAQEAGVAALQEVDSTTFSQVGYDAASQQLTVVFRDGGETYVYKGIAPEIAEAFVGAESLGTFYHANIRDKFEYDRK